MKFISAILLASVLGASSVLAQFEPKLELKQDDHIAIIGNALADRFQHSGWLEAYLYAKYPERNLVFRNLAVPADEVVLRHRPADFGSPDEWLTKVKASVVFAFFGFNESFQGQAGIGKFAGDLDHFLKETKGKNYSGQGAPRVVLFSPIANERMQDPNFPDPASNNVNLRAYTAVMAAVAQSNGVPFVDLYAPTLQFFAEAAARKQSLTINGIHLSDAGDKLVAEEIAKNFGGGKIPTERENLEGIRAAVIDKNEQWEARYRTIDGNNVYGGRSLLAYAPGKQMIYDRTPAAPYISNFKVMQEEMAQRDVLTANRDQRIWARANGYNLAMVDTNLPPVMAVPTDLPGSNTDGSYVFLGGEAAIAKMTVHSHMKVNLFASEELFPELVNPVQMAWDTKGRLWVAVWKNYPERAPESKVGDSLIILEDTKGTGKADKCTHFIDDLNAPTGFQFYKDGVLLMEAPDLWFVKNNNDHAGAIERVVMGLDSADSHHTANSICLEPGGAIYLSDGIFHRSHIETAAGPVRNIDGGIYRFEPNTGKLETYISYNFMNPHGRLFDYWGNDIVTDATGNNTYFGPAFSGHIDYPAKHQEMKQLWARPSRPCAGTGMISSRHFPASFQGDFLNCNVIGFQGIYLVKMVEDGSGLKGERQEDLISSSDPNFRPCAANIGPDGAIYVSDWQKPLIGHMQHHLRDPNRDHDHGRIYRITYEGSPLLTQPKIDGQSIPALLELLKEPENRTRELAKIELGKHDSGEVIAAVDQWASALDKQDTNYAHNLTEALWVHQWHNVVNLELLQTVLHSSTPEARAAAGRVLCYWRDRVPNALGLFQVLAADENPRVRLEAVRAASFFSDAKAAEVALAVLQHPMDYYLSYTLDETLRQLKPWWLPAIAKGPFSTPLGLKHLFGMLDMKELSRLPHTLAVLEAIVQRNGATETERLNALGQLSQSSGNTHVSQLFELYGAKIETNAAAATSFASLLVWQHRDELKPRRDRLVQLAKNSAYPELRRAAWVAAALADGTFDTVWSEAAKSNSSLADLLNGIPLLNDQEFRAKPYGRVQPLVDAKIDEPESIRRAAARAIVSMNYEPKTVFAMLTTLINKGEVVAAAAEGLRVIPRASWPKDHAAKAAKGLAAWARTVPAGDRTSQDYIETVQLASDLGGFLPAGEVAAFQNSLNQLRVPVFVIRTVREQMRYDTPRLVAQANQPIEIRFENVDFMPHNLVVVKPGTREKVGLATANMKPDQLDAEGRAFLADFPDILAATKLIEPAHNAVLKFTTPAKEGNYEYLCTFPGHYQIMRGELVVTTDVGNYLLKHPQVTLPVAAKGKSFE